MECLSFPTLPDFHHVFLVFLVSPFFSFFSFLYQTCSHPRLFCRWLTVLVSSQVRSPDAWFNLNSSSSASTPALQPSIFNLPCKMDGYVDLYYPSSHLH